MPTPTVALVAPYWVGHHPMYFGEYAASFQRIGARVIAICPKPAAGEQEIKQATQGQIEGISCHPLKSNRASILNNRFEGDPWHTFERWKHAGDAIFQAEAETQQHVDLVFFLHLDTYLRFLPFPRIPESLLGRPWAGLSLRCHHLLESRPTALGCFRSLAKGGPLMRSASCVGLGVLDERCVEPVSAFTGKPVSS